MPRKQQRRSQRGAVAQLAALLTRQLKVTGPPKTKKSRKQRPRPTRAAPGGHIDLVEGLINPFGLASRGVQIPDTGAGRTLPERYTTVGVATSDANGNVALGFQPSPFYPLVPGSLDAGATVFTPGAAYTATSAASYANHSSALRVANYGVRIMPVTPALTTSGTLYLGKQENLYLAPNTVPLNNASFTQYESHSLEHGAEYSVVAHSTGNDTANWATSSALNGATTPFNGGFENILVWATGVPASTPIFRYELTINFEYKIPPNDAIATFAKNQPVYNPAALVAVNAVHSDHTGFFRGLKHELGAEMRKRAEKAAIKHMGAVGKAAVTAAAL